MPETNIQRAQKAAQTAEVLTLVAAIVILATLATNYGMQSVAVLRDLRHLEGDPTLLDQINAILRVWVLVLPALLLVGALFELRKALQEYAKGEFFSPRSARGVRRAGEEAFVALLAHILVVPSILHWIDHHGGPPVLRMEPTDLALIAFLIGVAVIGRVLDLAVAVKAENDAIV